MKKNIRCWLSLQLMLSWILLANSAYAGGWTSAARINEVYPHASYESILLEHGAQINPDGCTHTRWVALHKTHPLFKELYSLILTVTATDAPISMYVSGCTSAGYAEVRNMMLVK